MKHLQSFSLFEARAPRLPSSLTSVLTSKQESFLNRYTRGTWSVNPTTGLVDVQGDFNCYGKKLKSLQGISFGHVSGHFSCHYNQLTTLAGAPTKVNGNFSCDGNQLTTLEGAPTTVNGSFACYGNHLTTLAGAPTTVGGDFHCGSNRLTTLVGAPTTVNGNFSCRSNQLTTLEGAPTTVGVNFSCDHNQLTTLEGAPTTVGGNFSCYVFRLESEEWNPAGWAKIVTTGTVEAQSLMQTLPQLQPEFWLNLHQKDRRTFNRIWVDYRRDPEIRRTPLYQEVEEALSGQARSNLDDLQDLQDLGI
jgi:hypothetical protein